jgi:iron only hydrogenase large subunit-like protein
LELRTDKQFQEYELTIGNRQVKIAVLYGVDTLRQKSKEILNNNYLFVEIRSCNFGCIGGCGQISGHDENEKAKKIRKIIYDFDEKNVINSPSKNPFIKGFYKEKGVDRLF